MQLSQLTGGPQFVRSLKNGPTIPILLVFGFKPDQPLGNADLCTDTGWSQKSVAQALRLLLSEGLVEHHARCNGWLLSPCGRQLLLSVALAWTEALAPGSGAEPARPQAGEVENLWLPAGSRCRTLLFSSSLCDDTTTTTGAGEPQNLPLPEAWQELVTLLVQRCATSPRGATATVRTALERGDDPETTRCEILRWLAYCQSPSGKGIHYPGAFIAARIRDGIYCPASFRVDPETAIGYELHGYERARRAASWGICPDCGCSVCQCDDEDGGYEDEEPAGLPAPLPASAQPAPAQDGPGHLDDTVAQPIERLVQAERVVAIADLKVEHVAHAQALVGPLQAQGAVPGRGDQGGATGQAQRLGGHVPQGQGLEAGVDHGPPGRRPAGGGGPHEQGRLHPHLPGAAGHVVKHRPPGLDLGDARLVGGDGDHDLGLAHRFPSLRASCAARSPPLYPRSPPPGKSSKARIGAAAHPSWRTSAASEAILDPADVSRREHL